MKRRAKIDPKAKERIRWLRAEVKNLTRELATIRAQWLEATAKAKWHDIATAPRDGTTIIVRTGGDGIPSTASYHQEPDGQAGWIAGVADGRVLVIQRTVTHWCRVPGWPTPAPKPAS